MSPTKIITNESNDSIKETTKEKNIILTPEQEEIIRKIVREEIDKIKQEENNKTGDTITKLMK